MHWGGHDVRPGGTKKLRDLAIVRFFPLVVVALGLIAGVPVTFLELAEELILLAADSLPVVVGQLAPFFAHLAGHLFPVAFNHVPVHSNTSSPTWCTRRTNGRLRTVSSE